MLRRKRPDHCYFPQQVRCSEMQLFQLLSGALEPTTFKRGWDREAGKRQKQGHQGEPVENSN